MSFFAVRGRRALSRRLLVGFLAKTRLHHQFQPKLLRLEDRLLLSGTPVGGYLAQPGHTMSDDGRYVLFGASGQVLPGVNGGVFVKDMQTGAVNRIDVTPTGAAANGESFEGTLSADGRYAVFNSTGTDLVAGENNTNGDGNVFVRDLVANTTTLVSVNDTGTSTGAGTSFAAYITPNGRYVVFQSTARDLAPNDPSPSGSDQVYERDLATGKTVLVTTGVDPRAFDGGYYDQTRPAVSDDGNSIAFTTADIDIGNRRNVYLRNVSAGTTTLLSVSDNSYQSGGNEDSSSPAISADGKFVAFSSWASNLAPTQTVAQYNVYIRNLNTNTTSVVSLDNNGAALGGGTDSWGYPEAPAISADGSRVAFSSSTPLTAGETSAPGGYVYVRDLTTNTTYQANINSNGAQPAPYGFAQAPQLSPDGRYVLFQSFDNGLVSQANGSPNYWHLFEHDLSTGTTTLIDVNDTGAASGNASNDSLSPTLTPDGRYVDFNSPASDLVPGDTDGKVDVFVRNVVGGTTTVVSSQIPLPNANPGGPYAVDEGGSVTLDGTQSTAVSGDSIVNYEWDFNYSPGGTFNVYATGPTVAFSANEEQATHNVALRVTDQYGLQSIATTTLTVTEEPPLADVSGPSSGVAGQPQMFTFTASDATPAEQAGPYTYNIDWGDNSQQTISSSQLSIAVDHSFSVDGAHVVQVSMTDADGDSTSATANTQITILPVQLQSGTLVVGGNNIILQAADANGGISVTVNGNPEGVFNPTSQIVVYGLAGGDTIQLEHAKIGRHKVDITVPAVIFGGNGGDTIDARGSSANNVLVGGLDNDLIYGGSGRDLLIGDGGADTLSGGNGDDILIGGTTAYDSNLAALDAIMAEWGRTDISYRQRIADLEGAASGGLNGQYVLNAATVHDDGASDQLVGGGGQDWYIAGANDVVAGKKHNEIVTTI
ncbi:MAG TPA: hypothetical protein VHC19_23555 [Pirellulales bacterium]|nr:hypothetical protein [Pirellulales bacterium]